MARPSVVKLAEPANAACATLPQRRMRNLSCMIIFRLYAPKRRSPAFRPPPVAAAANTSGEPWDPPRNFLETLWKPVDGHPNESSAIVQHIQPAAGSPDRRLPWKRDGNERVQPGERRGLANLPKTA
jgi:hypothetical protein